MTHFTSLKFRSCILLFLQICKNITITKMHETKLTKNVLNQFSNTTNQSIENFLQSFDFINDCK